MTTAPTALSPAFAWPRPTGFRLEEAHACPRCGGAVRALYTRIPGTPRAAEALPPSAAGWTAREFPGGLVADAPSHRPTGYWAWSPAGTCGWHLPLVDEGPEPWIDQLLARVLGGRPDQRVAAFSVERLLAAPWVLWTVPSDPAVAPLALLPGPAHLRSMLAGNPAPALNAAVPALTGEQAQRVAPAFVAATGAVLERRRAA